MARELGKHLHEVMGPGWYPVLTHRQYRAWQAWLALDLNTPSRTDHYIMAVQAEVRYQRRNPPAGFKLDDMRLEFVDKTKPESPEQIKAKAQRSQQSWMGMVGGQGATVTISREQAERIKALPPEEAARERMRLARGA